jgi:AraC-like DNA-binding protein
MIASEVKTSEPSDPHRTRETLRGVDGERLERSCDAIRFGRHAPGIDFAEVRLTTFAFAPHRHDTFALGITTDGVQSFRYRGRRRICLPRELHVLHPDELHDGAPATARGFAYRIVYVAPELVREALDGDELPFVREPVQKPSPATTRIASVLAEMDEPLDEVAALDVVASVADVVSTLGDTRKRRRERDDLAALERVREFIAAHAREQVRASTLEAVAGSDRYAIARGFRRAFGTSPDRYRTQRRLALARAAIEAGEPLARAAAAAGFADQSHFTRQFKRTYGFTPARWLALRRTDVR